MHIPARLTVLLCLFYSNFAPYVAPFAPFVLTRTGQISPSSHTPIATSSILASTSSTIWTPVVLYEEHVVESSKSGPPTQDITVEDLTPAINELVQSSGVQEGTVTVVSRHTTTAVAINEWESRLVDDIRSWLLGLAPPDDRSALPTPGGGVSYLHNDIDARPDSEDEKERCVENGWDVSSFDGPRGLAAWRAQEVRACESRRTNQ